MCFGSRALFLLWFKCRLLAATLALPHPSREVVRQQCMSLMLCKGTAENKGQLSQKVAEKGGFEKKFMLLLISYSATLWWKEARGSHLEAEWGRWDYKKACSGVNAHAREKKCSNSGAQSWLRNSITGCKCIYIPAGEWNGAWSPPK